MARRLKTDGRRCMLDLANPFEEIRDRAIRACNYAEPSISSGCQSDKMLAKK